MRTFKILLAIFSFTISYAFGQSPIKEIKIGEKVPDVFLGKILNSKTTSARFSDYKGKVVLIDFYATWCVPCIAALPKLDSLQKEFKDQLVVLPVAYQKRELVSESFKDIPSIKGLSLPVVVEDTIMQKLFPHHTVPHDVIVDQHGIVRAITSVESINSVTLKSYMSGNGVLLTPKVDVVSFNFEKPFFMNDKGIELLKSQFLITGYYDGVASRAGIYKMGASVNTRFECTNCTIRNLYRAAMLKRPAGSLDLPDNRMILKVSDPAPFDGPKMSSSDRPNWNKKYCYCVDLIVPPNRAGQMYDQLRNGLDDFFGYNSELQKVKLKCLEVKIVDSLKAKSISINSVFDRGADLWTFKKQTVQFFLKYINQYSSIPIVETTGFNENIDIQLTPDINNIPNLRSQLLLYGMDLVESYQTMDVIVISDKVK